MSLVHFLSFFLCYGTLLRALIHKRQVILIEIACLFFCLKMFWERRNPAISEHFYCKYWKATPPRSSFRSGVYAFSGVPDTPLSDKSFSQRGIVQFEGYRSHRGGIVQFESHALNFSEKTAKGIDTAVHFPDSASVGICFAISPVVITASRFCSGPTRQKWNT